MITVWEVLDYLKGWTRALLGDRLKRALVVLVVALLLVALTACSPRRLKAEVYGRTGVVLTHSQAVRMARVVRQVKNQPCAQQRALDMGFVAPADWSNCPGYIDLGNGVYGPPIGLKIRFCESTNNYTAQNKLSTASGAWQFLDSTWRGYGFSERYHVSKAKYASPFQQDEAFVYAYEQDGTRPWNESKGCWS